MADRAFPPQLLPCRHQQFCRNCIVDSTCRWCYNDHLECPICRQPIESILFDSELFPAVPDDTLAPDVIDITGDLSTPNSRPETRNPKPPETRNPEPGTQNPQPSTRNPQSSTLDLKASFSGPLKP